MNFKDKSLLPSLSFQEVVEPAIVEVSAVHNMIAVYDTGVHYRGLRSTHRVLFYSLSSRKLLKVIHELDHYPKEIIFHEDEPLVLIYATTAEQSRPVVNGEILIYDFAVDSVTTYRKLSPKLYKQRFGDNYIHIQRHQEEITDLARWVSKHPELAHYKELYDSTRPKRLSESDSQSAGQQTPKRKTEEVFKYRHASFELETDANTILFQKKRVGYYPTSRSPRWRELAISNGSLLEQLAAEAPLPYQHKYRKITFAVAAAGQGRIAVAYCNGLIELVDLADLSTVSIQLPDQVDCVQLIHIPAEKFLIVNGRVRHTRENRKAAGNILFKVFPDELRFEEIKRGDFRISAVSGSSMLLKPRFSPHRDNDRKKGMLLSLRSNEILDFELGPDLYLNNPLDSSHSEYIYGLAFGQDANRNQQVKIIRIIPSDNSQKEIIEFYFQAYPIGSFGVAIDDLFFFSGSSSRFIESPKVFAFQAGKEPLWEADIDRPICGMTKFFGARELLAVITVGKEIYLLDPLTGNTISQHTLAFIKDYQTVSAFHQVDKYLVIGFVDGSVRLLEVEI